MNGDKLYKYLKNKGITQNEMLKTSTFSRAKLYGLFKRNRITEPDKKIIIKDFNLPEDFFDNNYDDDILHEPMTKYIVASNENLLREIIEQKDIIIKQQNEIIEDLRRQLSVALKLTKVRNN